jgi:CubicO group peptidase (beta-lactamase class C family)
LTAAGGPATIIPRRRGGEIVKRAILIALLMTLTAASPAIPPAVSSYIVQDARQRGLSGVVLVRRDGDKAWIRSFGLADRAFAVPVRSRTRFRIASITKLFTSTMVMMLADEGKLEIDQPVHRYLPELRGGARDVTVRQLLNHTSGIPQYDRIATFEQALSEGVPNYQRPLTTEAMLKACCEGALVAKPGTRFDYNNADYLLLGRIIERLDGRSFDAALYRRLLKPLGLKDSGIARQAAIIDRLSPTYFLRPDTKSWMNDLPVYFENWDAAGAMYSTPEDVARFADALFGGRILKPASLKQMLDPGLDDYGFGLWSYSFKRNGRSHRVAKRPGSIMGANTMLYRLLDGRTTIVILANSNKVDLDEFAQRIAEKIVDQQPASSSSR